MLSLFIYKFNTFSNRYLVRNKYSSLFIYKFNTFFSNHYLVSDVQGNKDIKIKFCASQEGKQPDAMSNGVHVWWNMYKEWETIHYIFLYIL